jgi:hypothetical protein
MSVQILDGALSRNISVVGHTDLVGKSDCVQIMVDRGFAYVGNIFSHGFSVVDVREPRNPRPVSFVPSMHGKCWSGHLQAHGDLLLVANEYDPFLLNTSLDENTYYGSSAEEFAARSASAYGGMTIFDISTPGGPRQVGELPIDGLGVHRLWYVGGDYAYVSALVSGYSDCIFMIVDIRDPANPREVSRWWLPGMWSAGGESPGWQAGDRYACHHPIVANDVAYVSWRDGGLTLLDVSDASNPRLIAHRNWHPPFGGGTHTALPLTDRVPKPRPYVVVLDEAVLDNCADGTKYTWMVDVREPSNPVTVSTFPTPSEQDYCNAGGHFGPHNLHENRPGAFQSSELIFATYQNAGVRVFDISDAYRPAEVGYFVPPARFENWMDPRPDRPRVVHSMDVYVDPEGLMYVSDLNGGLAILQWEGN